LELKKGSSSNTLEVDQNFKKECPMNYPVLYQWSEEIASHLGSLNTWQVANVAVFSQGVIEAESCQQQQIARRVACGERVESAARRLRRFVDNVTFPLADFFEEWTRWIVSGLPQGEIYLLVDETKLGDRIGAMVVGVAWEGRCIPLAWRCYKANSAQAYPEEGQVKLIEEMLKTVQRGIPAEQTVIVLADRGIGTSPDLCRAVEGLGWLYLFRVTKHSKICTEVGDFAIAATVQEGEVWAASGRVFKKRGRVPAHARAIWAVGYDEPWALVTNCEALTGHEYAQRNWQEQSFRDLKSGGWQWGASRIRHPDHMERLLVVLVVAYAWILALGGRAVQAGRAHSLQRHPDGQVRRHWSLFKEGLQFFVEVVQRGGVCQELIFAPDTRFT
jgi:hypothetical protein